MSSLPIRNWINHLRDLATSPAAILVICGIMAYVAYTKTRRRHVTYDEEDYKNEGHVKQPVPLKGLQLTRKQLAKYNSNRADKTYLLALNDVIYDVSSGTKDFGPGGKHGLLPGTEITDFVRKESRKKGREFEICLNEWRMLLEDLFHPAGKLIDDPDTTLDSVPEEIEEIDETDEEEEPDLVVQEENNDVELGIGGEDTSSDGDSTHAALEGDSEATLKPPQIAH